MEAVKLLKAINSEIKRADKDAHIVTSPTDYSYYTGFSDGLHMAKSMIRQEVLNND